jgi:N-acetylmuramoyl-L-alanine amidase
MNKVKPILFSFNLSLTCFFFIIILFFFTPSINSYSQEKFKIVLDAGHGGKDPGRPNKNGIKEKNIVLNIALLLGKRLENNNNKVIYTRKDDRFLSLRKRASIANESDADLFISIHCNAFNDSRVYGFETFVYGLHVNKANFDVALKENEVIFLEEDFKKNYKGFDPNSPESLIGLTLMQEDYLDQSILLASFIQDNFSKKLKRKNRGVKQSGFWVLHNTYMPSVLVEAGFMTNSKEGAYLNSKKGQKEIADAIYDAIFKYKKSINFSDPPSILSKNNVSYRVQISASKNLVELYPYNFKGLEDITVFKGNNNYKYFFSNSTNFDDITKKKNKAIENGFKKAFIVTFKDGKPNN